MNLPPRVKIISDDDRRRLEAQNTIKRKREEREEKRKKRKKEDQKRQEEKQKWAEEVKDITPILTRAGKTREGKVSTFPQIRDFLKKAYKPTKAEFQTWDASNIVQKWNNYNK